MADVRESKGDRAAVAVFFGAIGEVRPPYLQVAGEARRESEVGYTQRRARRRKGLTWPLPSVTPESELVGIKSK